MRRRVRSFTVGIGLLLALDLVCAAQFRPWRRPSGDQNLSIDVGGVTRTYLLHVPKSLPEGKVVPLVLVFHGGESCVETQLCCVFLLAGEKTQQSCVSTESVQWHQNRLASL